MTDTSYFNRRTNRLGRKKKSYDQFRHNNTTGNLHLTIVYTRVFHFSERNRGEGEGGGGMICFRYIHGAINDRSTSVTKFLRYRKIQWQNSKETREGFDSLSLRVFLQRDVDRETFDEGDLAWPYNGAG